MATSATQVITGERLLPLTIWQSTKNVIYKINRVVFPIFSNLLFATAFMLLIALPIINIATASAIILAEYKTAAAVAVLGSAILTGVLGSKIAPWKDKFIRALFEIIEGVQGLAPQSAKEKKVRDDIRLSELIRALKGYRFPDNPLQMKKEAFALVNGKSHIQYLKEKTGGLGIVILNAEEVMGTKNPLPEKEQREALEAAHLKYENQIKRVSLKVEDLDSFLPILKSFKNLNLVLENAQLNKEQIKTLSKLDLNSLELKNCTFQEADLKGIKAKTPLFISDETGTRNNLDQLQKAFDEAIESKIIGPSKKEDIKELISDFIEGLSKNPDISYHQLARFGIRLNLVPFKTQENSEIFVQEFLKSGFVIKELEAPFPLTLQFFEPLLGKQIEVLKIVNTLEDYAKLNVYLPYLAELHLDFEGKSKKEPPDISALLQSLSVTSMEKVVVRRKIGSVPYLSFVRSTGMKQAYSYQVKVMEGGIDKGDSKADPLADLLKLEQESKKTRGKDREPAEKDNELIEITEVDVSGVSGLDKRSSFADLFNFCGRQEIVSLNLSNSGLKIGDFVRTKKNLKYDFFQRLQFLDVSHNPTLAGEVYLPDSVKVNREDSKLTVLTVTDS